MTSDKLNAFARHLSLLLEMQGLLMGLSEDGHRYRALNRKVGSVKLDSFNLMQGFRSEVAFSAARTGNHRNILNDQQLCSFAVTSCYVPDASAAFATNIANH